jgi:uncharacterized protein (DUF1697 family)
MNRYVAFLRAINVGGRTVKMERLRQLFSELGLEQVESFIASGNLIFVAGEPPARLEQTIEAHLHQALGYEVATFIRSIDEVIAITRYRPFTEATLAAAHALYVGFLTQSPTGEEQGKLLALNKDPSKDVHLFHFYERQLYWLAPTSIQDSKIDGAQIEKALGRPITFRNITTIDKLSAKYGMIKKP